MLKLIGKWLNIYQEEIGLFLWCFLVFFFVRSSSILFTNFAETAFLKRYGVEYLPIVMVANSISGFIIMGFVIGLMVRFPGSRLLVYMFLFCGGTVAGLRFVIPLGIDILYPVLFVLKAQYEVLLALLFWNLANDLFNTRQSKRLFPLITAGGGIGGIIGSFGTPFLAKAINLDNLMLAYLIATVIGAMAVKRMGTLFPTLLLTDQDGKKKRARSSMIGEFKKIVPLIKESKLVKILILLNFLPNLVLPILNYQFNFAIDQQFATESGMIAFFGTFRGVLNIINLIILLFVGKLYSRWGLPVALMFHPINYMIAFAAFLLRFDYFVAMYARISTRVLVTTINNPARAILVGLVPASQRALIRPFVRGQVVRIATFLSAGIIMLSEGFMHPRYLSIVSFFFVGTWIVTTFILKRDYSQILLDLISKNMLDLKSFEEDDVNHIFLDKKMQSNLVEAFLSSRGNTCLWYANLIKSLGMENLDANILSIIKEQDDKTRIGLLSLLSKDTGEKSIPVFEELVDPKKPDLTITVVKAAARLPYDISSGFLKKVYEDFENPEIRAYAVIGLYGHDPKTYKGVIDSWLPSKEIIERRAGIISAGGSTNKEYIHTFQKMLQGEADESVIALILNSLHLLDAPGINSLVFPYMAHPSKVVRKAALDAFNVSGDNAMRAVIPLLGDPSPEIHNLAIAKLHDSSYQNPELLIESLTIPDRKLREGIFSLLESLNIKDLDVFRFARSQVERAYRNLAETEALSTLQESQERDMLIDHLMQKKRERLETVLRVFATQDQSGQMRVIWRGIFSPDSRQKSNALEALDDSIGHSLSKTILPLLEELSSSQNLEVGRKNFQLPHFDSDPSTLFPHLLAKHDWVTVVLSLSLIGREDFDGLNRGIIEDLVLSENPHIRQMAQRIVNAEHSDLTPKETDMETSISIPDKILHLRGIQIFEGLSVSEMAAIASVTEEVIYPKGEDVIREGEQGETMYMMVSGEVSVIKGRDEGDEIELDRIHPGDYFGEMALFEDEVRSATIRTVEETNLLVLHKREFTEIVREYPQIALHICKVLSHRLRRLHEKVQHYEKK